MQLDDAATILGRAEFFDVCNAEQRRLLAFTSERKRYRPGAIIYKVGDDPEGAHVLISGTVATFEEGAEDNPFIVHRPGVVMGAMSLVVARPRPVALKAIDSVETLLVKRADFMKLANDFPDLAARAAQRIRSELVSYLSAIEQVRPKIGDQG